MWQGVGLGPTICGAFVALCGRVAAPVMRVIQFGVASAEAYRGAVKVLAEARKPRGRSPGVVRLEVMGCSASRCVASGRLRRPPMW